MENYVEKHARWYTDTQLDFDKVLIDYRFKTISEYFVKDSCLELGPADGVMTKLLVEKFSKLDLVEGSQELLDLIPNYSNVRKYCKLFEDFVPDRKYSTVIMEHVLEHIQNPVQVLKRVINWLDIDGVLIVGVPNAKSFHRLAAVKMGLLTTEYELNERDIQLGHYRIYDLNSLENDIIESGYKVKNRGGVFFKALSNRQIQDNWSVEMINGFYELGKDFQFNAAEIFVVASK